MDYTLENLGPERFQHMCQALLVKEFPGVTCLPIGQPDGGRDALRRPNDADIHFTIYQVKYARQVPSDLRLRDWVLAAIDGEVEKVKRLVSRGATRYVLVTNVAGTSHLDVGSIDSLQNEVNERLPIPATCWWRDDINRRLDGSWDIKLRYPEVLSGQDFLRLVLESERGQVQARRQRAINTFLTDQYNEDVDVKFKQIELQNKLLDLFVDLPFKLMIHQPEGRPERIPNLPVPLRFYPGNSPRTLVADSDTRRLHTLGTATLLLSELGDERLEQIVVEGAPGQGKSTLTQYLCQVHRIRWLNKLNDLGKLPDQDKETPLRLPFKVDLRDLSAWLSGSDPFPENSKPSEPRTLETFLARLVRHRSGGLDFDVNDLHEVSRAAPLFIALDGLDEVADIKRRAEVVAAVTKALPRLRENCSGLRVIITSRPAAFANSPGFELEQFPHLELGSVRRHQIVLYANRWMDVRNLTLRERLEFTQIVEEKMEQPHLRDLARNPMQLAILLSLINTRGVALPDKRTSLYDAYVEMFFSREAAKSLIVRRHIDLLKDIHRYLAWVLHTAAEGGRKNAGGRISQVELRSTLQSYLLKEQHKTLVIDEIFDAMLERVVMIVSRVEGTFEFEVQPLREYFAARHLYDTASYSPPGRERSGSKPDRFDAIARNPYWLNVTRFFAGCFSKGELLDLAERIKELVNDPVLGRTGHPVLLGAMLLSDWVFSQTPRAVAEVSSVLSSKDALRRLVVEEPKYGARSAVQIPKDCGGAEMVVKAFDLLSERNTRRDFGKRLADFIMANISTEEIDAAWLERLNEQPEGGISRWLQIGHDLGSLGRISGPRLPSTVDFLSPKHSVLVALSRAGRFDLVMSTDDGRERTLDYILSSRPQYEATERDGLAPLYLLPALLSCGDYLAYGRGRYDFEIDTDSVERFKEVSGGQQDTGLTSNVEVEAQAFSISLKMLALLGDGEHRAAPSLSAVLLEELVEECRGYWGDKPSLIALANALGHLPGRSSSRAKADSLFSSNKQLCSRIRLAKARRNNITWWASQVAEMQTSSERFLLFLTLCTWAPTSVFFSLADELSAALDGLADTEWNTLLDFVVVVLRRPVVSRASVGDFKLLPRRIPSRRLALFIGLKDDGTYGHAVFVDYLANGGDNSKAMASFRQSRAFEAAMSNALDWPSALAVIRSTYAEGVSYPLSRFVAPSRGLRELPETVAQQVLGNAADYPLSLWQVAETSASFIARKDIRLVSRIAKEDHWFDE